jgi:predicted acylesterase/phospholipase RssA
MEKTPCKILRSIVLSGGGTRCISFVGALLFLRSRGFLAGVTRWYCCSAGSLIAMLFALDVSDSLIKKFVLEFDFEKSRDINAESVFSLFETFGIDRGFALRRIISRLLESLRAKSNTWTLREFRAETGHDMHFFISNVTTSQPFFASADSHPDLFVLDAIYATMAIPFYFQPYKYKDHYWCDGMLGQNFPWAYIPEKHKPTALGFYFPRLPVLDKTLSLFEYLNSIISFRNNYETDKVVAKWSANCIEVPTSEFPSILLTLSKEDRKYLFGVGLKQVKKWFSQNDNMFMSSLKSKNYPLMQNPSVHRTRSQSHSVLEEQVSDNRKFLPSPYKDSPAPQGLLQPSQRCYRRWSL